MTKMDVYRVNLNPTKTTPLALGNLVAVAKKYHPELSEHFNFQTPWLTEPSIAGKKTEMEKFSRPSIFLMSDYIWNHQHHRAFSKALKSINPEHIIIHGGPSIPIHESPSSTEFEYVDFFVHSEGEQTFMDLMSRICSDKKFKQVKGISFRDGDSVARTELRGRIEDLSTIPSPYLTGEFDTLFPGFSCAVVETNRGCPFNCAYCSWGFYLKKIVKQDLQQIFEELEWLAIRKVPALWLADANFGIVEQDMAIVEHICKLKKRYGFPQRVVAALVNNKHRSLEISKRLIEANISNFLVVAIQTSDKKTLRNIRRKPYSPDYFKILKEEYTKYHLPILVHIMIGLPGSTYESFKKDIRLSLEEKMFPMIFPTVVIPNTAMNKPEYRKEHGIITEMFRSNEYDEDWEMIVATNTFSRDEYKKIHMYSAWVHFAVCFRALKYITYFVSKEKGIPQDSVLELFWGHIKDEINKTSGEKHVPVLQQVVAALMEKVDKFFEQKIYTHIRLQPQDIIQRLNSETLWDDFYNEVREILSTKFDLDDEMIDDVVSMQQSVLPFKNNPLKEMQLKYDFVSYYFQDINQNSAKSLKEFKETITFPVSDPKKLCDNIERVETDPRFLLGDFELNSPLWRNE